MRDNDNGRDVDRNTRPQMLKHSLSQVAPLGRFEICWAAFIGAGGDSH
jgi:hypothetical protein